MDHFNIGTYYYFFFYIFFGGRGEICHPAAHSHPADIRAEETAAWSAIIIIMWERRRAGFPHVQGAYKGGWGCGKLMGVGGIVCHGAARNTAACVAIGDRSHGCKRDSIAYLLVWLLSANLGTKI